MADFLSDEEQVERLRRWWSENGLALIAAVVLAVGGVVGWRWYQDWRVERAAAAADAYAAYLDARAVGEDATALFDAIATEHEGTIYHVFALFFEAKDAVAATDLDGAVLRLTESVALADEEVLKDAARLRLARVLYEMDSPAAALVQLGAVEGAGYEDDVAELTGDIHFSQGALGAAREAYRAAFEAAAAGPHREVLELKLRSVPVAAEGTTEEPPSAEPPDEPEPPTAAAPETQAAPVPETQAAPAPDGTVPAPPDEGA